MKLRGYEVRGIVIFLTLVILGVMAACGGGGKSAHRAVLPQLDGSGSTASHGGKYGFSFTEADIPNLSPEIQELLAHPGWEGPPSPIPPVSGAPMPEPPTVEDLIAMKRDLIERSDGLYRNVEPVVPVKSASYNVIPPDDPGYYPSLGEYDLDDWDPGGGDTPPPPFGVDDDEDGYEDLFEGRDDWFVTVYKSFVKEGVTLQNQFNRGSLTAGDEVTAVFQSYRHEEGSEATGEFHYRAAESGILLDPYSVSDLYYEQFNMATDLTRFSDPTTVVWYAVMIAAASEVNDNGGAHFESTNCPNETLADYQAFSYDPDKLPLLDVSAESWEENSSLVGSIMTSLISSENEYIQELITEQTTEDDPYATFGCIGMILQRWVDDKYSPLDDAWQGRLGWPLSDPWVDRNGRVLTGPLGQYRRYGQWFERGFMWWNDYLDPSTPDEIYIYTTEEDSVLDPGAEMVQDPTVVRYGLGGPLGMTITAYPLMANVGDPIYFHAFPYGGPLGNVNAFDDDVFVWNWRDGNYYVGDGTEKLRTHAFFTEAKYVPRVMLVLDVDGDGNADGSNPDYVYFADSPEIQIGHLGTGLTTPIVIVEDNAANADAIAADLDALEIAYDRVLSGDVADASDLEDYLLTIWACPYNSTSALSSGEQQIIMDVCQVNEQHMLIVYSRIYPYNISSTFRQFCGSTSSSYPRYTNYFMYSPSGKPNRGLNTAGLPLGSGPGGTLSEIIMDWRNWFWYYWLSDYFSYIYYRYPSSDTTKLAEALSRYYWTVWMRDANGAADNGMFCFFGLNWERIQGTTPSAVGSTGVMQNLFNQIDPLILTGGGAGEDEVVPYDGPVDIADMFGWILDSEAGDMSGGTDMDINVIGGPETVQFECLARASTGVDLIYQWEFEPATGWSTLTRYTAHTYIAAIDIDGDGNTSYDPDDWFTVNSRVYDSSYGSYDLAPGDARDSDTFDMRVNGGVTAVWIDDNGTVNNTPYDLEEDGSLIIGLDYAVGGGDTSYNGIVIDYDYDFVTFDDPPAPGTDEVTANGTDGSYHYDLTIPSAQPGYNYYIAIRVYDDDAPNLYDTYAWVDPFMGGAPVGLIDDGDTPMVNQFEDDLDDIGTAYATVDRSDLDSASDLDGYQLVIWCATNVNTNSNDTIDSTEKGWLVDYVQGGGDLFFSHNYLNAITDNAPPADPPEEFLQILGAQYSYYINWYGNEIWMRAGRSWSDGPGGSLTACSTSDNNRSYCNIDYWSYGSNVEGTVTMYGWTSSFHSGWFRDNLPSTNPGGMAGFLSPRWQTITSNRVNLFKNILDTYDPDLLP